MKKIIFFCLTIIFAITPQSWIFAQNQIKNIYIESDGNNAFEAKIKANKYGMRQALKLMSNKMGLDKFGQVSIPYKLLQNVFTQIDLYDEESQDTFYKAYVSYEYDPQELNRIILEYGSQEIKDKFYEYAVIPVLKRRNDLYTQRPNQVLLSAWKQYNDEMNDYKLFYPKNLSVYQSLINTSGFNKITYRDVLKVSDMRLFKKVIFIVVEEFAATTSGQSYVKVDYHIYKPDVKEEAKSNIVYLEDGNHNKSLTDVVGTVVSKIIDDYGSFQSHVHALKLDDVPVPPEVKKTAMYAQIYSKEELQSIKNKLKNAGIRFEISPRAGSENLYDILLITNLAGEKLAEALYNNRLSYKDNKERGLMLFEIQKGV